MNTEKKEVALKSEEKEFSVEDIYTPLSVAKEEIWRRWNDKELRKKVEDFLGGDICSFFKEGPKAIIGRHIATPNKEFFRFIDLARITELPIAAIEYLDDTYTSRNPLKYHLCKMYFHGGFGKNGGDRISTKTVVAFDHIEGKRLNQLGTIWKQDLSQFHHEILKSYCSEIELIDISKRFENMENDFEGFYLKYLTIYTVFGILFENYLYKDSEKDLTQNIVIPSIKKIEKKFGVKPLIVPTLPFEDEDDLFWCFYPQNLENKIKQKIYDVQPGNVSPSL